MAKPLLPDDLWEIIEPILPEWNPGPKGGQPRLDDRKALTGILFVLKTGIPWEDLPQEMGYGCGMTCWRRLLDWQAASIWDRIHKVLLDRLRKADRIDWSRAAVDSSSVCAAHGRRGDGPSPVDRAKPGTKHHALTDGVGTPLVTAVTAANRHDVTRLLPLVDAVPGMTGKPDSPRSRPDRLLADRAYDSEPHRDALRERGIEPLLARRGTEHGSGLGVYRWVVERTLGWFHQNRRLRIRYERRADIHQAFLTLAAIKICFNVLSATSC